MVNQLKPIKMKVEATTSVKCKIDIYLEAAAYSYLCSYSYAVEVVPSFAAVLESIP